MVGIGYISPVLPNDSGGWYYVAEITLGGRVIGRMRSRAYREADTALTAIEELRGAIESESVDDTEEETE